MKTEAFNHKLQKNITDHLLSMRTNLLFAPVNSIHKLPSRTLKRPNKAQDIMINLRDNKSKDSGNLHGSVFILDEYLCV